MTFPRLRSRKEPGSSIDEPGFSFWSCQKYAFVSDRNEKPGIREANGGFYARYEQYERICNPDEVTTKVEKGIPSGMPFTLCGEPAAIGGTKSAIRFF